MTTMATIPWAQIVKANEPVEVQFEGDLVLRRLSRLHSEDHGELWVESPSTVGRMKLCQFSPSSSPIEALDGVSFVCPVKLFLENSKDEIHIFGDLVGSNEDESDCDSDATIRAILGEDVVPKLVGTMSDEGDSDEESISEPEQGVTIEEMVDEEAKKDTRTQCEALVELKAKAKATNDKPKVVKAKLQVAQSTPKQEETSTRAEASKKNDVRVQKTGGKDNKTQAQQPKDATKEIRTVSPEGAEKPGVRRELPGGLVYEILKVGSNQKRASKGKQVTVQYRGTLAKNGKQFDKGSLQLTVGAGEVVKGFDKGVEGMMLNEERRIFIPAALGYGSQRVGPIPANSNLIFDITLKKVN